MAEELDGQVAIVTGGGRGIGRAIAEAFAAAGAAVVVSARSAEQLEATVATITAAGGRALAVPADVTDQGDVERLVAETERSFGPVDVLVSNAGVAHPIAPLWEIEPEDWRRTLEVDLYGPFLCARAVLPGMIRRGGGRIINMSTAVGGRGIPYYSGYAAAKTGLTYLTECLAVETAEHGIAVFSVHPGGVDTDMAAATRASAWNRKTEDYLGIDPATRWTTPAERIARLCVALASGRADSLTGRHLTVRQDLDALVQQTDQIVEGDLYVLRLRTPS